MSISADKVSGLAELKTLTRENNRESRYAERNGIDQYYLLAVVHSAIAEQTDETWTLFHESYSPIIKHWLHNHRIRDLALRWDSEENYTAMTVSRFWLSVSDRHIEFTTLSAVLSYLHATLEAVLIDIIRFNLRVRSRESQLPESDHLPESSTGDSRDSQHLCECVQALLVDEQQKRLAYLLYYCGLKPREIARLCAKEFDNVKDIYRLHNNIMERLRRNSARLRYLLDQPSECL